MPGQKLNTTTDSRFSYDKETGAVRSFFGAELVSKPEPGPEAMGPSDLIGHEEFSFESEARDFLEVNKEQFKLEGISLKHPDVREGAAIRSVRYLQCHFDVPVYGAELTVAFRASDGQALSASNSIDYAIPDSMRPEDVRLSFKDAEEAVRQMLHNEVREISPYETALFVYRHSVQPREPMPHIKGLFRRSMTERGVGIEGKLYWVWQVVIETSAPDGNWEVLVDATDGKIIAVFDRRRYASPRAYVFRPDPITSSRNVDLTWDADVLLDAERREVYLEELEPDSTGMCYLHSKWVKCVDRDKPDHTPPSSTGDFMYGSKDRAFLFAMSYYWTNELVKYLLSFNIPQLDKDLKQIEIDAVACEQMTATGGTVVLDNSVFQIKNGKPGIHFGNGGVPDASDAHVIAHEYVHVLHHFLGLSLGGFEEGFGDFLAAVWLDRFNDHLFQREIVFPWDGKGMNWANGRKLNVETPLNNPDVIYGTYEIGSIWATALWKLFISIGGGDQKCKDTRIAAADTVVRLYLEMLLKAQNSGTAEDLAGLLIAVDQGLYGNKGKYRQQMCDAFGSMGVWKGEPPCKPF